MFEIGLPSGPFGPRRIRRTYAADGRSQTGQRTRLRVAWDRRKTPEASDRKTVSVDLSDSPTDLDSTHIVLTEFRDTHDEFENFFGDVFDQLQTLSVELFARHKCLEIRAHQAAEEDGVAAEHRDQFRQVLEALGELQAEIRASHVEAKRAWAEICDAHKQSLQEHAQLREVQEELRRVGAEFHGLREDLDRERADLHQRQEAMRNQLAQLEAVAAQLVDAESHADHGPQLLEASRQQAAWQQERAGLQSELDQLRCRDAQQNETLSEHKRLASQHQAELSAELKRMRSLLETLAGQMGTEQPINSQITEKCLSPPDAAALGSVLAQFEMLQHDIAQRRGGKGRGPKGKD